MLDRKELISLILPNGRKNKSISKLVGLVEPTIWSFSIYDINSTPSLRWEERQTFYFRQQLISSENIRDKSGEVIAPRKNMHPTIADWYIKTYSNYMVQVISHELAHLIECTDEHVLLPNYGITRIPLFYQPREREVMQIQSTLLRFCGFNLSRLINAAEFDGTKYSEEFVLRELKRKHELIVSSVNIKNERMKSEWF